MHPNTARCCIVLLLLICIAKAIPVANNEERNDLLIRDDVIEEQLKKEAFRKPKENTIHRDDRDANWACAKWSGAQCVKWVRVGFWFGH
eukprot:gene10215-18897_t